MFTVVLFPALSRITGVPIERSCHRRYGLRRRSRTPRLIRGQRITVHAPNPQNVGHPDGRISKIIYRRLSTADLPGCSGAAPP